MNEKNIDSKLIVIIYDEAKGFNSRGALTKFNQKVKARLMMVRGKSGMK